jgi:hypothetical protein
MKRLFSLIVGFLLLTIVVHGQQLRLEPTVIASAGGYATSENGNISLSWTLGELAVSTLYGNNLILTQGFQQPFSLGTSINLNTSIDWNITAYPNPVEDQLKIRFDLQTNNHFWIEIQDVTGRTIELNQHKDIQSGDIITVDMSDYMYGVYFFKVYTNESSQHQEDLRSNIKFSYRSALCKYAEGTFFFILWFH